ncbi:hypothetical protein N184_19400 [Sinorhizobium sp. GL28]|nr:hypothetical protein N184_19400 [Sinorhizobium sp. GL28]
MNEVHLQVEISNEEYLEHPALSSGATGSGKMLYIQSARASFVRSLERTAL